MLLQEILSKSEADPTRGVETLLAKAAGLNDISSVLGTTVGSEQSKEERELYIGNVPPNVTNAQFVDFLNRTIEYLHLNTAKGGPVLNAWVSVEGQYAFVQLRSIDETNNALLLNGLPCLGQPLKVGRPKANVNAKGLPTATSLANFIKNDGPKKLRELGVQEEDVNKKEEEESEESKTRDFKNDLVIVNVMKGLSDDTVKQIFSAFGTVISFRFVPDAEKESSAPTTEIVQLQYENAADNAKAIQGLEGFELGTHKLEIMTYEQAKERGVLKSVVVVAAENNETTDADNKTADETTKKEDLEKVVSSASSRVIELCNMVTDDDLKDDEEYEDIKLDVEDECNTTGRVVSLEIPRSGVGMGKIFVLFETPEGASKTLKSLSGKHFGGRTVVANFFSEEKYVEKNWGGL